MGQRASSSKKREISALEKSDSSSGPPKESFINNHGSSNQFEWDSNTSAAFVNLDAECGMDELLSKKRKISALEKNDSSSGTPKESFINNHGSSSQFFRDSNTSATFADLDE